MKQKTGTSKELFSHICENLDQAFDSPECEALRKHYEHCSNCKKYLNSLKTTISLYKSYRVPPLSLKTMKTFEKAAVTKK
jgi:hypothetical protein